MLKNIYSTYQPNRRPSNTWYKMKKFMTEDVVILGYTPGKGKYSSQIGALVYGQKLQDGNYIILGNVSGISDELRFNITNNPEKYLHKVIEIQTTGRTKNMGFEHPSFIRFRDDKAPEECIIPKEVYNGK